MMPDHNGPEVAMPQVAVDESPTDEQATRITRRGVLKSSALTAGTFALGGTAVSGTTSAAPPTTAASSNVVPVDLFVRPADTEEAEPTPPAPADDDLLVERTRGLPVDDGTDPETVDGEMGQLTWGQFSDIEGRIRLKCLGKGTHVSMHLRGLVPKALYTAWVVVFDSPGFDPTTRNIETATQNVVGWAPLGENDGSENVFRPSASGEAHVTAIDEPDTWPNGPAAATGRESERCLLDEFEVRFIGGYHLDDVNRGSQFRPNAVEQFAFVATDGELV